MNINDLIQHWNNAVDAINLEESALEVRTSISAGIRWRQTTNGTKNEVCKYTDDDYFIGDCTSCTNTWTAEPC